VKRGVAIVVASCRLVLIGLDQPVDGMSIASLGGVNDIGDRVFR
jgi:hypothetical protein